MCQGYCKGNVRVMCAKGTVRVRVMCAKGAVHCPPQLEQAAPMQCPREIQTRHGDLPGVELSLERVDMLEDSNVASPG